MLGGTLGAGVKHLIGMVAMLLLVPNVAHAETIVFEAYELQAGGGRKLLQRGARGYFPGVDVTVTQRGPSGTGGHWSKSLLLFGEYEIGADVYREPELDGFGLVIRKRDNPNGFSWEWFNREADDVFTKLQGSGRLRVAVAKSDGGVELTGVEFLDDVVLRYKVDIRSEDPGAHTHEIVIKKGSIFRFPPSRPTNR